MREFSEGKIIPSLTSNAKRVIADQGGWAVRTDAVDIYFKTGRTKLLYAVANAGTKHLKIKKKLRRV